MSVIVRMTYLLRHRPRDRLELLDRLLDQQGHRDLRPHPHLIMLLSLLTLEWRTQKEWKQCAKCLTVCHRTSHVKYEQPLILKENAVTINLRLSLLCWCIILKHGQIFCKISYLYCTKKKIKSMWQNIQRKTRQVKGKNKLFSARMAHLY